MNEVSLKSGRNALVLGGSMAGLLAARVLSEHFEQVTVIERDRLLDSPDQRKGVPQGRHAHGLLCKGEQILSGLFPGLFQELVEDGSIRIDMGAECAWFQFGLWKIRARVGVNAYLQSRPFLEWKVRRRVEALPNVRFIDQAEVTGLIASQDRSRIVGVKLRREGQVEHKGGVDLVVDASGRGSRLPQWLEELGYPRVDESLVRVDVGYASREFHAPSVGSWDWRMMVVAPSPPAERRIGVIFAQEGGRWVVTLGGWLKDYPPADEEGFLAFARSLPRKEPAEFIAAARPAGPISTLRFPTNQRRHYEQLARFPDGLVVLGDSVCSFNPIYGQGMTTSALQAMALDESLRDYRRAHPTGALMGFSESFQARVARIVELPWTMATTEDMRFTEPPGGKPFAARAMHWYTRMVHRGSSHSPEVLRSFLRVMHMLEPPAALFRPRVLLKVLGSAPREDAGSWSGAPIPGAP